ncbi:MAG: hypothetical protein ABIJ34_07570 [archaeon]
MLTILKDKKFINFHFVSVLIVTLILVISIYHIQTKESIDIDRRLEKLFTGHDETASWFKLNMISTYLKGGLGDPRVIFESNFNTNGQFGSTRIFEILPYLSGRSIMEGLYHQSGTNSPFMFHLDSRISETEKGVDDTFGCSSFSVQKAKPLLRLFNVGDVILFSDKAKSAVASDPDFELRKIVKEFEIYRFKLNDSHYVTVPKNYPIIMDNDNFKLITYLWVLNEMYDQPLINGKDIDLQDISLKFFPVITNVSELESYKGNEIIENCSINESLSQTEIDFRTSCVGLPHLIKVSYYPNWKVSGASDIYQVTPSFMMVIPNNNVVKLSYGYTFPNIFGYIFTVVGIILLVIIVFNKELIYKILNLIFLNRILLFVSKNRIILCFIMLFAVSFFFTFQNSERNQLFMDVAIKNNYLDTCYFAGSLKNRCIIGVINNTGKLSRCSEKFLQTRLRDECIYVVAQKYKSSSICSNITDSGLQVKCGEDILNNTLVRVYSIGIYTGNSLFNVSNEAIYNNPVLTYKTPTDINASFVADPFLLKHNNTYYLFFEAMDRDKDKGVIVLATSNDTQIWSYDRVVLEEKYQLTYPHVFEWQGEFFMVPETVATNSIQLYKASNFPYNWTKQATLIAGDEFVDSTPIYFDNTWWIFTSIRDKTMRLYYASDLYGPWYEHRQSPFYIDNYNMSRASGRFLIVNNTIIRFTQKDFPKYGLEVNAFQVMNLTKREFGETFVQNMLRKGNESWNNQGMHQFSALQIDQDYWVAAVDGWTYKSILELKNYSLEFNHKN